VLVDREEVPLTPDELARAFPWPLPEGAREVRWTARGFEVDGVPRGVLSFGVQDSAWTDDLTNLHELEAGAVHPIDLASRARALRELALAMRDDAVVVEVGCSSGWLLRDARRALPGALVIGCDYVRGPLERLATELPGVPLVQMDLTRCPLPDASADAVVALNVLEHIADDNAAVRELFRILKPGGIAVIELPAGPQLFDIYDKVLMHHRRYTLTQATALFTRVGFRVAAPSHLGFFLYPAFVLVKLRNKRYLASPEGEQRRRVARSMRQTRVSRAFKVALDLERALGRLVRFPVGIRCVFTAVKS
jgi:SAM-dependent methyltransferase